MTSQNIKDRNGNILGVVRPGVGGTLLTDRNGNHLGYTSNGQAFDKNGNPLGDAAVLMTLIPPKR
jgi:hypothetical protein